MYFSPASPQQFFDRMRTIDELRPFRGQRAMNSASLSIERPGRALLSVFEHDAFRSQAIPNLVS